MHTPRRCGLSLSAGVLFFATLSWRPLRTSCWIVGNRVSVFPSLRPALTRTPSRSVLLSLRDTERRKPRNGTRPTAQPGLSHPPPTPEVGRVAVTGHQRLVLSRL